MQAFVIDFLNQFGYLGIFLLIAIENIFPPIPSEIILTFGGFMTIHTQMQVWGVVLAATAGSTAGAVLLYWVGRILNADRMERLFNSKLGRALHLKSEDVWRSEKWFLKYGNQAVFFCRFVPIIRSLISIPAGFAKMSFKTFLPLTMVGTCIWNLVLVLLGRATGNAWGKIAHYVDLYTEFVAVIIIAAVVVMLALFFKSRFVSIKKWRK